MAEFTKVILTKNLVKTKVQCAALCSKNNFEKLVILINEFLDKNKIQIDNLNKIYVNRGPGSYGAIRNSLSVVKAFNLARKIDYYCYSFDDFNEFLLIEYADVPRLCEKYRIKKNLINPIYLS